MEAIRGRLSRRGRRLQAAWEGSSSRAHRTVLILIVVAVAAGGVTWARARSDGSALRMVRGQVAWVALDGVAVALADREDSDALFFVGSGAAWTGVDGLRREPGQPECLPPDSRGALVELGVLPELEGTYPNQVAWVRCITLPTGFRNDEEISHPPLDHAYQQALERQG